jgi:hypothetical protein
MAASRYQLPPLILHPFTNAVNSGEVLQAAKDAAEKLLAAEGSDSQSRQLQLRLLAGRFAELRMLLFVGKDLFRWMEQCLDFTGRHPELSRRGYALQSFAEFLIGRTPPEVDAKLRRWGVTDYARIFSRSIGIYAQFQEPPDEDTLQEDYLRSYYRYADYAYACWRDGAKFPVPPPGEFNFSLFASGEYSKLLEEQWRG